MEWLITLILILLGLFVLCLACFVIYVTFNGAAHTLEEWGGFVILIWIFAFPFMLVVSFVVGLGNFFDDWTAPEREAADRKRETDERYEKALALERVKGRATNELKSRVNEFGEMTLEYVVQYEYTRTAEQRSQYDFQNFISKKGHVTSLKWWRGSSAQEPAWDIDAEGKPFKLLDVILVEHQINTKKAQIIEALDYPEYIGNDLLEAVSKMRTEKDFLQKYEHMIAFFDGKYDRNKTWKENEEEDQLAQDRLAAKEIRKAQIRSRFDEPKS